MFLLLHKQATPPLCGWPHSIATLWYAGDLLVVACIADGKPDQHGIRQANGCWCGVGAL